MTPALLATPGAEACDAVGGAFRLERREWPRCQDFHFIASAGLVGLLRPKVVGVRKTDVRRKPHSDNSLDRR
jgi:hypothetical protein